MRTKELLLWWNKMERLYRNGLWIATALFGISSGIGFGQGDLKIAFINLGIMVIRNEGGKRRWECNVCNHGEFKKR